MDVRETRASRYPSGRNVVSIEVDVANAAELHAGALFGQQGANGAPGRIQPRLPAGVARGHRYQLRRPHGWHAAGFSDPATTRWRREGHRRVARCKRAVRIAYAG